jgi:hypothetical protein
MMTSEELLIDRITSSMRADVSDVQTPADLLERLRIARDSGSQTRRPGARAAELLGLCAGVAVVVIAVLVVTSIGSNAPQRSASTGTSSEKAIIARLAVLRRPQTAADRLTRRALRQLQVGQHLTIVPDLTRLVATVHVAAAPQAPPVKVYLAVVQRAHAAYTVTTLRAIERFEFFAQSGRTLVAPGVAVATGGRGTAAVGSPGDVVGESEVFASVVPDGVARVKWVFSGYNGLRARPGPVITVYPRIENNVALASPRDVEGYLATATWYGSNGRVIASFSDRKQILSQQLGYELAIARSARNSTAPQLANTYSVFRTPTPRPASIQQPYEQWAAAAVARNSYRLNVAQARLIPLKNLTGFWAVPGSRGFAILDGPSTIAKGAISGSGSALSDGLMLLLRIGPRVEQVIGLVPDGNRTVTVVVGGGRRWTVKVLDNAYVATVTGKVKYVIETNAAGQRTNVRAPSHAQCQYKPCG